MYFPPTHPSNLVVRTITKPLASFCLNQSHCHPPLFHSFSPSEYFRLSPRVLFPSDSLTALFSPLVHSHQRAGNSREDHRPGPKGDGDPRPVLATRPPQLHFHEPNISSNIHPNLLRSSKGKPPQVLPFSVNTHSPGGLRKRRCWDFPKREEDDTVETIAISNSERKEISYLTCGVSNSQYCSLGINSKRKRMFHSPPFWRKLHQLCWTLVLPLANQKNLPGDARPAHRPFLRGFTMRRFDAIQCHLLNSK